MKHALPFALMAALALCGGCGQKQEQAPAPDTDASQRPAAKAPAAKEGFLKTDGLRFIDADGRQVILHGANVGEKSKAKGYLCWHGPSEFSDMRDWGFNCIRLLISWDAIEPEPGQFNDAYLAELDKRIAWAKENGIYVILDMHQDLYSEAIPGGNGAPAWATLTDGKEHVHLGGTWSDAYFTSPAVQTAFDNFWANKPAPDGVGLQDHYAAAWRHVAQHYADNPTIAGYDLMNEPFMGSGALATQMAMIAEGARVLSEKTGQPVTTEELVGKWLDPSKRGEIATLLSDLSIYEGLTNAGEPSSQEFERTKVMPMFQRVANAIREADANHIIFLGTSSFANMGIRSALEPLKTQDGSRDPRQAYAPHGYDIVLDTPSAADASFDRLGFIFRRHQETTERLEVPMVVTEWGAFYGDANAAPVARYTIGEFEKYLCGDTYWDYSPGFGADVETYELQRPYPCAVAGTLVNYRTSPEEKEFECVWQEGQRAKAPTVLYVPGSYVEGGTIQVLPADSKFTTAPTREGSKNVFVTVPPLGKAGERRVVVGK